jgi:hypothetical protein
MKPTNKVTAGVLAGALTSITVWALNKYLHAELTTEIAMAGQVVFTFAVQWLVPDAE